MANKHQYIDPNTCKQKIGGKYSGWGYTDATTHADCPKCGSTKGFYCETPKGKIASHPHTQRLEALNQTGYNANRVTVNGPANPHNGLQVMDGATFLVDLKKKLGI